jgi:ATP-binding cassette, subfamily G (WHITE), member 2, PDR
MSLVGNFSFGPNDRSEEVAGVGVGSPGRRPSYYQDGSNEDPHIGLSKVTSSRSGRRQSKTAEDAPTASNYLDPEKEKEKEITPSGTTTVAVTDSEDEELEKREETVRGLARQLTNRTSISISPDPAHIFNPDKDSQLDPNSSNFNARAWTKAIVRLSEQDPENHKPRSAGIAFRNLNVWGFGAATDYQKSVGNVWLESVGIVRKLFGIGQRRIDILRDFEGLVEAGEMLVVLGPPGSGCTTLLKTISGETHGFNVDKQAYLNYQGEPFLSGIKTSTVTNNLSQVSALMTCTTIFAVKPSIPLKSMCISLC